MRRFARAFLASFLGLLLISASAPRAQEPGQAIQDILGLIQEAQKLQKKKRGSDQKPGAIPNEQGQATYRVSGIELKQKIDFGSKEFRDYKCKRSDLSSALLFCTSQEIKNEPRGSFSSTRSILYSKDSGAVYVNEFISPAYWSPTEANDDIKQLKETFKQEPRLEAMPRRVGLPDGVIAAWGDVRLEALDSVGRKELSEGRSPKQGLLVDFLNDLTLSAQSGLPIYKLGGAAGYVWIGTFDHQGKGRLRFLAADMSALGATASPSNDPISSAATNTPTVENRGGLSVRENWLLDQKNAAAVNAARSLADKEAAERQTIRLEADKQNAENALKRSEEEKARAEAADAQKLSQVEAEKLRAENALEKSEEEKAQAEAANAQKLSQVEAEKLRTENALKKSEEEKTQAEALSAQKLSEFLSERSTERVWFLFAASVAAAIAFFLGTRFAGGRNPASQYRTNLTKRMRAKTSNVSTAPDVDTESVFSSNPSEQGQSSNTYKVDYAELERDIQDAVKQKQRSKNKETLVGIIVLSIILYAMIKYADNGPNIVTRIDLDNTSDLALVFVSADERNFVVNKIVINDSCVLKNPNSATDNQFECDRGGDKPCLGPTVKMGERIVAISEKLLEKVGCKGEPPYRMLFETSIGTTSFTRRLPQSAKELQRSEQTTGEQHAAYDPKALDDCLAKNPHNVVCASDKDCLGSSEGLQYRKDCFAKFQPAANEARQSVQQQSRYDRKSLADCLARNPWGTQSCPLDDPYCEKATMAAQWNQNCYYQNGTNELEVFGDALRDLGRAVNNRH